jgi:hypothetical protein
MNIPSPHNFAQRKLELMFGVSYAAFIYSAAVMLFLRAGRITGTGAFTVKKVFLYVLSFFFVVNFSLTLWFNYANQPTGDEPIYLLTAYSLIHDRDIDLKNNFENGDYKSFYSRDLKPQGDNLNVDGKMYPKHPFMFSVLIAPFFLLGGAAGVSLFMCFLSALLVALLFYLSYRINNDMTASITAAFLAGLTLPIIAFINLSGTDVLCSVIIVSSYILYRFKPEKVMLFSLIMSAAVWIHIRILPVYAVIAMLFIIKQKRNPAALLKFVLVQVLSFVAFFGINYMIYKDFIPYSSHQTSGIKFGTYLLRGIFVFFFDRELGLFSFAPFYLMCIPGIYLLYKRSRIITAEFALIFVPYYILIAVYPDWGWGNASPRYLLPLIFVFAATAAETISGMKSVLEKRLFYLLGSASIGISLIVSAVPWFRWDKSGHESWLVYLISSFSKKDFTAVFPSLINMDGRTVAALFLWIFFCGVV